MARRINLVPQSERARTSTNVAALGLVAAALIVVFALGFGYWQLSTSLDNRKQDLTEAKQKTQSLKLEVGALAQFEDLARLRGDAEAVVRDVYAGRTLVSDILNTMSLVLPENVWFETLDIATLDPGTVVDATEGTTGAAMNITGNTYTFEDVAQLLVRLQLIPALSDINLVSAGAPLGTIDPTKDVKGFAIESKVNNTQPDDTPLPVSQVEVEGL